MIDGINSYYGRRVIWDRMEFIFRRYYILVDLNCVYTFINTRWIEYVVSKADIYESIFSYQCFISVLQYRICQQWASLIEIGVDIQADDFTGCNIYCEIDCLFNIRVAI